ncbi:MAG: GTPase Era [Bdellovibrionales bacterium]|nr:GTPase Era [Bdellovibrionales bacterium]
MSYKAGFIGLVGLPNAGKSSLANMVVGSKFSIVCSKAQTTRRRVMGIYNDDECQFVITDAPGVVGTTSGLNTFLQEEYRDVMDKSDVLLACLNLDANNPETLTSICEAVKAQNKPWAIAITKVDLPKIHRISILRELFSGYGVPVVGVSTETDIKSHTEVLIDLFKTLLPEATAPMYPTDSYTTESVRDLSAELVREKCFKYLHDEIPYGLATQVRKFEEGAALQKIFVDIVVERDSHKSMVIGRNGEHLKRIGMEARKDIEQVTGTKVYLELHVAVKDKWTRNPMQLKDFGYVVRKQN